MLEDLGKKVAEQRKSARDENEEPEEEPEEPENPLSNVKLQGSKRCVCPSVLGHNRLGHTSDGGPLVPLYCHPIQVKLSPSNQPLFPVNNMYGGWE